MAVQVANFPQPLNSPFMTVPSASYGGMGQPSSSSPGNWGMTQLPNVPRPPFLNYTPSASRTTPPASLPSLPPPSALLNNPASGLNPASTAGLTSLSGNPASRTPFDTANSLMLAENPPPQMVAPYLYLRLPRQNSYVLPPATPQLPPQPVAQQAPPAAPQPKQMPPQAPPPQLPPQPMQQPPAPQQPLSKDGPTTPIPEDGLDDATIRSLFEQLKSTKTEGERSGATIELLQILQNNPGLATNPKYKPYIDAFMQRIMKDKSPVVRGGGETILEMGLIQQPDEQLHGILKDIAKKGNSLTNEGSIAAGIESRANAGTLKPLPQKDKDKDEKEKAVTQEKGSLPGMNPGTGPMAPANPAAGNGPLPASWETAPANNAPNGPGSSPQVPQTLPPAPQQLPAMPQQGTPQANIPPSLPNNAMGGQAGLMPARLAAGANGIPARFSGSASNPTAAYGLGQGSGGRLNLMSPQQTAIPVDGMAGAGQRLNVREGM